MRDRRWLRHRLSACDGRDVNVVPDCAWLQAVAVFAGTGQPQPCPVGHYCLVGNGTYPCPRLTYRDTTGAAVITDCHPCVAGHWCNYTGERSLCVRLVCFCCCCCWWWGVCVCVCVLCVCVCACVCFCVCVCVDVRVCVYRYGRLHSHFNQSPGMADYTVTVINPQVSQTTQSLQ